MYIRERQRDNNCTKNSNKNLNNVYASYTIAYGIEN